MDEQIVSSGTYSEIVEFSQISEYIELAFQIVPLLDKALDLPKQLAEEETKRLAIRENADNQRRIIERRMDQLDAELAADLNTINVSMRVFEKMVENGHIEQAMILHERVINKLSGRVSIAADKFNQNNPDGRVKFYTT